MDISDETFSSRELEAIHASMLSARTSRLRANLPPSKTGDQLLRKIEKMRGCKRTWKKN